MTDYREDPDEPYDDSFDEPIADYDDLEKGMLVSALILTPFESNRPTVWKIEDWDNIELEGPPVCATDLDLVEVLEVIEDEDGEQLFIVKPITKGLSEVPADMIGKVYIVPYDNLDPPRPESILNCIAEEIDDIIDSGLTRTEMTKRLKHILRWVGYPTEED